MFACENCKYLERYHKFPNPMASSVPWCTKCNEEIEYNSKTGTTWFPKECYHNDYFEPSDEVKEREATKYMAGFLAYQVD